MQELRHYIEAFSSLHTAKVKGVKAPHKAVLLLAVIDLVEEKVIGSPRIRLTDALNDKFNEIWMRYIGHFAIFTADICKPFYHMQYEPFWNLVEKHSTLMAAETVAPSCERKDLPKGGYTIKADTTKIFKLTDGDPEIIKTTGLGELIQQKSGDIIDKFIAHCQVYADEDVKVEYQDEHMKSIMSIILTLQTTGYFIKQFGNDFTMEFKLERYDTDSGKWDSITANLPSSFSKDEPYGKKVGRDEWLENLSAVGMKTWTTTTILLVLSSLSFHNRRMPSHTGVHSPSSVQASVRASTQTEVS